MERRVDGEQVWKEVAVIVDEVVDPLHADRPVPSLASIVSEGALWRSSPRLLAERTAPYPQTVVAGIVAGRIC